LVSEKVSIMENSTGKKDDLKKFKVENIKEVTQMTETVGQKLQTQAHIFKT
jgi:hypothetical protein